MLRFLSRRLGFMVIALVFVSLLTFILMHMAPGNFLDAKRISSGDVSGDEQASVDVIAEMEKRYGLDKPLYIQYLTYMKGMATWDMGPSFQFPQMDIQEIIAKAFPVSLTLALFSVALSIIIAVPLGILAAVKQNTVWDYCSMFLSMIGNSIPAYVLAVFLILFFSLKLHWLPTAGWTEPKHVIMPVLALGLGSVGGIARYMRTSMVEALRQDYIAAAWAKGGSFTRVVLGHALRNSLIPLITVVGPQLARLMVGTVFIESMFRVPGLGSYFTLAANTRDFPLLMTSSVFFAFVIMMMNLVVDLMYGFLDPRIRFE
ncbi:MAG: binding-protein-dependent transport system inner rane component [Symbiobacteriaceae bacterium]|nr:binding-protein-dependent transport system inner rane component [Symbiobacteriaceae bacterium]